MSFSFNFFLKLIEWVFHSKNKWSSCNQVLKTKLWGINFRDLNTWEHKWGWEANSIKGSVLIMLFGYRWSHCQYTTWHIINGKYLIINYVHDPSTNWQVNIPRANRAALATLHLYTVRGSCVHNYIPRDKHVNSTPPVFFWCYICFSIIMC